MVWRLAFDQQMNGEDNTDMMDEEELIKNGYELRERCYDGGKFGDKSVEAYAEKNEESFAKIVLNKPLLGAIVSMLTNYEHLLWEKFNGGGKGGEDGLRDGAWDVGDVYEALHDSIVDAGLKLYEKTDETPKGCELDSAYVV